MKKSVLETIETRQRIVNSAARELRMNGIEGSPLKDLMAAADRTKGGFYRHFKSKDQLVAEACVTALESIIRNVHGSVEKSRKKNGLKPIVTEYLSRRHRDDPATSCPFVTLGSELARADKATRTDMTKGLLKIVELIAGQYDDRKDVARRKALAAISAMVGALTMARIVVDSGLSDEILDATERLLTQEQ